MLPRLQVSTHDIDSTVRSFRDCDDLFTEVDRDTLGLDVTRGPGEVVSEFLPCGYRRAIINEGKETALRVEVIQEGYR